ncbi:hypothetical protein [Chelativorans salis]|uniref:Heme exporter protein D n=1 Tax=Chelativorans salis TaxID=2978478 RepID=A0ABT2LUA5_9HYPH|nr:hypothetical protein [Chelativorans sp. EGI FJ00035]MCT7377427.1 hypothetical protein [Chelativorans sp. EGI FJ00035]
MEPLMNYLWLFAVAGGPAILAAAFIYALLKRRRLKREERKKRDEATRELYRQ